MLDILDVKSKDNIINCVDWVILTRLLEASMVRRVRGDAAGVTPFRHRFYAVRLPLNLASV